MAKAAKGQALVIVESPTKARTITKFLGKDFIVKSVAAAYPLGAGVGPVSPLWRLDK